MEIKEGQTYRTKNGRPAKVFMTDGGGAYPVKGVVKISDKWALAEWTKDGWRYEDCDPSPNDLFKEESLLPITEGDYIARDGKEAKVFMIAKNSDYPLIGAINYGGGEWYAESWKLTGHFRQDGEYALDLVERKY